MIVCAVWTAPTHQILEKHIFSPSAVSLLLNLDLFVLSCYCNLLQFGLHYFCHNLMQKPWTPNTPNTIQVWSDSYPVQVRVDQSHVVVAGDDVSQRRQTFLYPLNVNRVWKGVPDVLQLLICRVVWNKKTVAVSCGNKTSTFHSRFYAGRFVTQRASDFQNVIHFKFTDSNLTLYTHYD